MLDFKPIKLSDKSWVEPLMHKGNLKTSDMNFTNLYTWADGFKCEAAEYDSMLCLRFGFLKDKPCYAFPVGTGSVTAAVEAMRDDARRLGVPFVLRVSQDALPVLEDSYRGCYNLQSNDNWDDYIYSAERLATLSGKKLHAKRNHIHRFEEQYNWSFEPVDDYNLNDCRKMSEAWFSQVSNERDMDFGGEEKALGLLFQDYDVLRPEGGLIRAGGEVVAFTFGELLCDNMFLIHFEKAYPHIQGGYTMINREFARYVMEKHPNVRWINREEDMGLNNLRKAKQSYFPDMMMVKYLATWR